ncbi:MAG: hypothetical protein KAQ94_08850 [Arcobacteraceae bacterium]|nr:hypothetical protein [Arcobacteraceae bacterium]
MNKQAITLVEVLVSVMLISVVIVSLLQIKENNLHFLEKSKDTIKYNSYIAMVSLDNDKNIRNKNIYLDEEIKFKDDDIRKEFKNIKIKVKDEELEPIEFSTDEYTLQINIKQTSLSMENKTQKSFFRFSLLE